MNLDAHIIINAAAADEVGGAVGVVGVGGTGMGVGGMGGMGGVDNGIVTLDQNVNDDSAMRVPPGAPGPIEGTPRVRAGTFGLGMRDKHGHEHHGHPRARGREELTPRAVFASPPLHGPMPASMSVPGPTKPSDDIEDGSDFNNDSTVLG